MTQSLHPDQSEVSDVEHIKPLEVRLGLVCAVTELDEQSSFVGNKSNQHWLWHAVDCGTGKVLVYVMANEKKLSSRS